MAYWLAGRFTERVACLDSYKIRTPKDIDKRKLRNYIAFMPKTEIRYDARLELTLESELKQAFTAYAKQAGLSRNEAIRQAMQTMMLAARCRKPTPTEFEVMRQRAKELGLT